MFPSPIGVLYISIRSPNFFPLTSSVSVPYWGSLYFNEEIKFAWKFDSEFPSPIGVLYISIMGRINYDEVDKYVSVPYWGSLYFNPNAKKFRKWVTADVSVPYWGSLYFNLCKSNKTREKRN